MPFTESDRYDILSHLGITIDHFELLIQRLAAIEARSETLVHKCQQLSSQLTEAQEAYAKVGSKEAGLIRADVLEWSATDKICQLKRYQSDLKRQLARLIGWELESEVKNVF